MQPPSLDPSLKIYHRVGTRKHLTETRREKQTSVSELSTLGFGQEMGDLHQADVWNLRKEDLPPQSPCKLWILYMAFSGDLSIPRDGHMEVNLELQVGEAKGSLGVFAFPCCSCFLCRKDEVWQSLWFHKEGLRRQLS